MKKIILFLILFFSFGISSVFSAGEKISQTDVLIKSGIYSVGGAGVLGNEKIYHNQNSSIRSLDLSGTDISLSYGLNTVNIQLANGKRFLALGGGDWYYNTHWYGKSRIISQDGTITQGIGTQVYDNGTNQIRFCNNGLGFGTADNDSGSWTSLVNGVPQSGKSKLSGCFYNTTFGYGFTLIESNNYWILINSLSSITNTQFSYTAIPKTGGNVLTGFIPLPANYSGKIRNYNINYFAFSFVSTTGEYGSFALSANLNGFLPLDDKSLSNTYIIYTKINSPTNFDYFTIPSGQNILALSPGGYNLYNSFGIGTDVSGGKFYTYVNKSNELYRSIVNIINEDTGAGGTGGNNTNGNVTLSNCKYENITYKNGWCLVDMSDLNGNCNTQDNNYMQCEATLNYNNSYSQLIFKNLINPINFPNIWRANNDNIFTFNDSRGWTSGTKDPIFAVKGDIPIIGYTLYDSNSGTGTLNNKTYRVQTYGSSNSPIIPGSFNDKIETTIRTFNTPTYFSLTQKQFQFELLGKTFNIPGVQNEYKFGLDFWGYCPLDTTTLVCDGSDGYLYIDGEKTTEKVGNRDKIQDYIDNNNNPNKPIQGGTVPTTTSPTCQKYYKEWDTGNFTNVDLSLSIIPCGFSYMVKKITHTLGKFFDFNISLKKEKKEGDFWEWVKNNSSAFIPTTHADFLGYEGEGNSQINNIIKNIGGNEKVKVGDNALGLVKIIAKIILNIAGFVFMCTCFIPSNKGVNTGESITGVAWKLLLIIFFIISIFTIEIIANFTNINPLGLLEILNFFDLGYRTAVYMLLIGVFAHTVRNFS